MITRIPLVAIFLVMCASVLNAAVPPASNFDLSHWKLTLPIDDDGGITGEATEIKNPQLQTYSSQFFYTGPDGAMVFWSPVQGATTANATDPRSELRELIDPRSSTVNWPAEGTHILRAQCKVTQQPDSGAVMIGQIHGYPVQRLVKLQYNNGQLQAYIRNKIASSGDTKFTYTVATNALITYEIKVVDGVASVTVNGVTRSHNFYATDSAWRNSKYYFKAGAYLQDNSGPVTEGGRVSFYQISVNHGETPEQIAPTISTQPVSRNVNEGSPVSFSVVADGSPALNYQWRKNGASVAGATASTYALGNARTNDAGSYAVVVANAFGSATSALATLTVASTNIVTPPPSPIVPLSVALDANALGWTTDGSPAWTGRTNVTHDGTDAAESGAIGHSKTTSMQTTVQGPGAVSFWWKVSSEPSNDRLLFYVNGSEKARITGQVDWQWRTFNLSSGSQVLKWTYSKNSSKTGGVDRAWVDQVQFGVVAPTITTQPASLLVDAGSTATFSVTAVGTPTLTYRWLFNGVALSNGSGISGATASKLTISNVQSPRVGAYSVVVSNSANAVTSAAATLSLGANVTLEQALDGAGLTFTTGGTGQPWRGQTVVTHDGADAAQTGGVGDSTYTWIKSRVNGPATLTFRWKLSSEKDHDYLRFMLDAVDQTRISGEVDWQLITFNVPSGSHELQWRYSKNSNTAAGQDRGWLDQVQLVPSFAALGDEPGASLLSTEVVASVELSGDEALLTWNATAGRTYQVFYTEDLFEPNWLLLAGGVEAADSVCSVTDGVGAAKRFYRVVED